MKSPTVLPVGWLRMRPSEPEVRCVCNKITESSNTPSWSDGEESSREPLSGGLDEFLGMFTHLI